MKTLIMTAVEAERKAVLQGLADAKDVDVVCAGVGPVAAAIETTKAIAAKKYDLIISAGIGGGFSNRTELGSIVIATEIIAADLGAETNDGFSSIEKLGFGISRVPVYETVANKLTDALQNKKLSSRAGVILTCSTVTGSLETAQRLVERVPNAAAEAMEGFGVALAAYMHKIPVLEIRTISNFVGPRQREAWKITEALSSLEQASKTLAEVLS